MTDLDEKTSKYHTMLSEAIDAVRVIKDTDEAEEFLEVARSYLKDGEYFLDKDDEVNALVAFSYGHAWLDAGMRLGLYETDKEELFAA